MATTTTTLPLRAAATHLGISTDTLRKRLQRGLTPGRKVDGAWVVDVLDSPGPVPDNQDGPGPVQDVSGPTQMPNLAQRAEDMAVYSHRLLAPYVRQIAEQAERIGHLEERCTSLQAELAECERGRAETHDAAPEPERRSWWHRLGLVWG